MEERLKADEAEVEGQWFPNWERQCLGAAGEEERLSPEQDEEEVAGPRSEQQKLWHLFQISATSVAQLYKGSGCPQSELSMWDPFQSAAMALTSLYKESGSAHQRSFDLGVKVGNQRRIKDVLDWAKKGRSTILREDLISFLCGKVPPKPPDPPPPQTARTATEASSSVDVDLQPFHDAIALHGLSGAMASISVQSGPPSTPPQASGISSTVTSDGLQKSSVFEDDVNSSVSEDQVPYLASGGTRKRPSGQCTDGSSSSPTHKRNRLV
ncbi:PREDICTED: UPF0472 protein C16orf72 [Miniopterus natalensis]|uniref:UPF0472 protein C16orf72 n=1 Tax=Miniopterus natalensis TaxID=291302 RepID=UPI0007A6FBC6|nr:PREDICTED: UPF0472 protein C16orf72 [Miniopterus natalensis]